MKRGEIWSVSGAPGYGSKPRPALIVQSDHLAGTDSVVTCGLTSQFNLDMPFRPLIAPTAENGLGLPSNVMVEKLTAIPRGKLGALIGVVAEADMTRVELAMALVLGIGW